SFAQDQKVYNVLDIALIDCHTETSSELVLNQIFDAASAGVRGWVVWMECVPFAHYKDLSDEDRRSIAGIVGLEIEVRRKGSVQVEELRLSVENPSGVALLSRTVADFVSDRAVGRSVFEYRQRVNRTTSADAWSDWREESGSAASIYLS
ncbi:MAG: hypothetical protein ABW352_22820, partial [Polyangiales bacterium]